MKDENYIVLQGWMVNNLGLTGDTLIVYAMIYGFSQDDESDFHGSVEFIQGVLGKSAPVVREILKKLVQLGLITRVEVPGQCNHYSTNRGVVRNFTPKESCGGVERNLQGTPKESCGDNKNNNKYISNKQSLPTRAREFSDAVWSIAQDLQWYDATDIQAFIDYWSEPNQQQTKMRCEMEKTWSTAGRMRSWRKRTEERAARPAPAAAPVRESVVAHNARVLQSILSK